MRSCQILPLLVAGSLLAAIPMAGADEGHDFFESKIRPILIERCYDCHGPDSAAEGDLRVDSLAALLQGGNTGPALKPGKPEESLLIDAVNHGKLYQMPPKLKLPAREIADLTAWVTMGAPWPDAKPADTAPVAKDADQLPPKARDFWAFRSPSRPEIPAVANRTWVQSPIDYFVLHGLEAKGLSPALPADKRALIRRATFDLIGLPPTPEEVDAFVKDNGPDAFAKVIDRLLASPHYGERWGRHWLDVARYADSNGMDENLAFINAWRYRDYVIDAFNADLPYDQFVREQLAGDLMTSGSHEDKVRRQVATAFLSLGPKMLAEDDPRKMQMDIVDEQIDTVGRAFLGLTLGCARCHDHKFDPVPTSDYYGLAGIFKSTKTMENYTVVAVWHERPVPSQEEKDRYDQHQAKLAAKRQEMLDLRAKASAAVLTEARGAIGKYLLAADELRQAEEVPPLMKPFLGPGDATPPNVIFLEAESFDRGNVLADDKNYGAGIGIILNRGELPNFVEYDVEIAAATAYQLEVRYAAAEARSVRVFLDGKLIRSESAANSTGSWTPETQTWFAEAAFDLEAGKHTIRLERQGPFPHFDKLALVPWPASEGPVPKTGEQIAAAKDLHLDFVIGWKKFLTGKGWDAKTAEEILLALTSHADWESRETLTDADQEELRQAIFDMDGPFAIPAESDTLYPPTIQTQLATLKGEEAELAKATPALPQAMGVTEGTVEDLPVHYRGNHLTLAAQAVPRRFPRVIAGEKQEPLPQDASGRLELAYWLTQPDHPLTARVMVNRIWRWHFGTGLVRTPDNFGQLGDQPADQALLDWLAVHFVESGWSIKSMHREVMLSSTYQMSTAYDERAAELDPENRWHWRMDRRRLEAEAIRDAMLAVSGALDTTRGGPVLDVKPREYVAGTASVNKTNYESTRRSVYLPVIRSALYEVFQAFDFAEPSMLNGDRPTTTVAPQALFMMNSPLVSAQTERLARRLLETGGTDEDRVIALYQLALSRQPTAKEMSRALDFTRRCLEELAQQGVASDQRRQQAWQSLCRVILASSEFIHLE